MKKIMQVHTNGYRLTCHMSDGSVYEYDMNFVNAENSEMIAPLKNEEFFKKVFIEYGCLAWPNGYDIHANTVAREGRLVKNQAS